MTLFLSVKELGSLALSVAVRSVESHLCHKTFVEIEELIL